MQATPGILGFARGSEDGQSLKILQDLPKGGEMLLAFSKRHLGLALGVMAVVTATTMSKAAPPQTKPSTVVAFAVSP